MDDFEKFILDHRDEFDDKTPAPNLWEGIDLPAVPTYNLARRYKRYLWQAAAAVIIFVSAMGVQRYLMTPRQIESADNKIEIVLPENVVEAENFYSTQVQQKLHTLRANPAFSDEMEREINYDLAELDSVYTDLMNDLQDQVGNEEVLEAMMMNYRLKVEILERLLQQLDTTDTESKKTENYEL